MWDGSTLTLRNATIKEAKEYTEKGNEKIAIYRASGDLALALVGKNTVDALGDGSAASCGINLGSGSLTIRGEKKPLCRSLVDRQRAGTAAAFMPMARSPWKAAP